MAHRLLRNDLKFTSEVLDAADWFTYSSRPASMGSIVSIFPAIPQVHPEPLWLPLTITTNLGTTSVQVSALTTKTMINNNSTSFLVPLNLKPKLHDLWKVSMMRTSRWLKNLVQVLLWKSTVCPFRSQPSRFNHPFQIKRTRSPTRFRRALFNPRYPPSY